VRHAGLRALGTLAPLAAAAQIAAAEPGGTLGRCRGACSVAIYGGSYVDSAMSDILLLDPQTPITWDYEDDHFLGVAVSREVGRAWRLRIEPELGVGQRFGRQSATELWGAVFVRYRGFPWDDVLTTTVAVSTGLNYASEITAVEQDRARDGEGSRLMHFFSPEVTFALPTRPDVELMFRMHHRSGVFGLVSDAWGGAQYGTVGLRVRF
jgi:hypothetical protein